MSFRAYAAIVDQSATLVYEHEADDIEVWIRSSGNERFGGDDQVTLATGMEFNHGGGGFIFYSRVSPGDQLWAIRTLATGTSNVRVLVRKA